MLSLVLVLGTVIGLGADPLLWVPAALAAFSKRWWAPLLAGMAGALLSEIIVQNLGDSAAMGYHGQIAVWRIVSGAVDGLILLGVASFIRYVRRLNAAGAPAQAEPPKPVE